MIKYISILVGPALAASQYFIWVYAPGEATMGEIQRIFYFHLSFAWWAFVCFFLVFAASIGVLTRKNEFWNHLAGASGEVGVLFTTLTLVTGSLWAKGAWNTWWTWDPRLSTALIMWFVYCAYLVLRSGAPESLKIRRISAVLGIVAFLDVPLVFLSARLWRSMHPAVFASKGGGLSPEMWHATLASLLAWGIFTFALLFLRTRQFQARERIVQLNQG
ncbi:MAG: cytochrome c biogenesis protein CcsA [Desulfonatronovibrionaceae bacterium]